MRFSWDIATQAVIYLLSAGAFLYFLNTYLQRNISFDDILYLVFFLAVLLSFWGNGEKSAIRNDTLFLFCCLAASFMWKYVPFKDKKRLLLLPPLIGFFFTVILAYLNVASPSFFSLNAPPKELFINPNVLAGYLVIVLPLSFRYWFGRGKTPVLLSLFLFAGIILTRSRWAIAVSALSFAAYAVFFYRDYKRVYILLLAGVSTLIIIFLSWIKFSQYLVDQAGFLSNRIQWWQGALNMFSNNIFNGVGWGNFGNYYPVYKTGPGLNTIFAHNILFQMLGETGIFGPLLFAAIVISAFAGFARKLSTRPVSKYFFAPVFLSLVSFISLNVLDYSFYIPALSMLFWILLSSFADRPLVLRRKTPANNPVVYFVFIIMSLFVLLPLKSAVHLSGAQRLLKLCQYDKAESEAWKAVNSDPLGSEGFAKLAEIDFSRYAATRDPVYLSKAIEHQSEALLKSPENSVYYNDLAWLYWTENDRPRAIGAMKKALAYNRFNDKYSRTLNSFINLSKTGRHDK
jgi:O-antigen ligase